MDREDGGASKEGEEDNRETDNEVDEVAFNVEPEVMRADGEHAPFRQEDEDEADNPRAGDDSGEDRADAKKDVHRDMENIREGVATFSDKYVI